MNLMGVSWKIKNSLKNLLNLLFKFVCKSPHYSKLFWVIIQNIKKIKLQVETHLLEFLIKPIYGDIKLNKIFYINPKKVKFMLNNKKFFHWKKSYRIMGGSWDKNTRLVSNYIVFDSIKKRYIYGKNWEDTELYHLLPEEVNNKKIWTYKSKRERDLEIAKIDKLYKNIKEFGYRKNTGIDSMEGWILKRKIEHVLDEVVLAIGRNGDYFFVNGKHRLAIAKILNLKKIPVIFLIRHKKWMIFRKRFSNFINKDHTQKCANIKHPDLQNINFDNCYEIFEILKGDIKSSQNNIILTLGAKLGYICSKFEEIGFKCHAVELNPIFYYFLKKLKDIEKWNFNISKEYNFERLKKIGFNIIYLEEDFLNRFNLTEEFIKLVNFSHIETIYINKTENFHYSNNQKKLNLLIDSIISKTHLKTKYKIFTCSNGNEIIKLI